MDNVLKFSKKLLIEIIDKNSIVVDATCGNGNDTLFLAKTSAKKIFSFDIQEKAILNTKKLILENNLINKCEIILDSHENFYKYINNKIDAVIFNLGYLPRSNHLVTTNHITTLNTIFKFLKNLKIGGRIVIVVYSGHKEGKIEKNYLLENLSKLNQKKVEVLKYSFINQKNEAPFILAIEKLEELDDK